MFAGRRKVYGKDGALLIPSPNTKKAAPELLLLLQGNSWFLCDSNKHWAQALQRQAMARSASGPEGSLLGGALLWQPVGYTAQQRPQRGRLRRKLHKGEWSGEGRWCLIHSPFLSHVLFLQMTPDEVSIFQEASRVPKQSPREDSKGKWQQKQTWYELLFPMSWNTRPEHWRPRDPLSYSHIIILVPEQGT